MITDGKENKIHLWWVIILYFKQSISFFLVKKGENEVSVTKLYVFFEQRINMFIPGRLKKAYYKDKMMTVTK